MNHAVALAAGIIVGALYHVGASDIYVFAESNEAFAQNIGIRCDCEPTFLGANRRWVGRARGGACDVSPAPAFGLSKRRYRKQGGGFQSLTIPENSCCQTFPQKVPQINGNKFTAVTCG
ncbi:MAG: hypothetical protein ACU841_11190 [Gammaproteobacteria bacterium]